MFNPASVTWDRSMIEPIRAVYEPIVDSLLFLLPAWVREVVIQYDSDVDHPVMVVVFHEYRFIRMTFGRHALDQPGQDVEVRNVIHEFMHCYTSTTKNVAEAALKELTSGATYEIVMKQICSALEGENCDLEDLIYRTGLIHPTWRPCQTLNETR